MAAPKAAAEGRDRPLVNANFLVEIAGTSSGFAEASFAPFTIAHGEAAQGSLLAAAGSIANRLVLRRGATGALDLYAWWDQARQGHAPPRRVVKVKLLGDDHATVLMTWRFRNVRPVSLAYSPLDAMDGGVLMETIELAYDEVTMS
jgi:phage tail-like protein